MYAFEFEYTLTSAKGKLIRKQLFESERAFYDCIVTWDKMGGNTYEYSVTPENVGNNLLNAKRIDVETFPNYISCKGRPEYLHTSNCTQTWCVRKDKSLLS